MAIAVAAGAAMGNPFPHPLNAATRTNARNAIHSLGYGNIWSTTGSNPQATVGNVRVDYQGTTSTGAANLQLQINGITGHSTIATALVSASVSATSPGTTARGAAQKTEITRKAKHALLGSLTSFITGNPQNWTVTGTPSS